MAWRFHRRLKIFPGITLNFGKKGSGLSYTTYRPYTTASARTPNAAAFTKRGTYRSLDPSRLADAIAAGLNGHSIQDATRGPVVLHAHKWENYSYTRVYLRVPITNGYFEDYGYVEIRPDNEISFAEWHSEEIRAIVRAVVAKAGDA
jgi:hypothetical protein